MNDVRLAARRFFSTVLRLRCPACGYGNVTNGPLSVKDRCPRCGARYDRMEGNELISIPLSFFIGSILTFLAAVALVLTYGFFDGLMWVLFGLAVVLVLVLLRPVRVTTLWMLWLLGFVYPDRVREKGRHVLPLEGATGDPREPERA